MGGYWARLKINHKFLIFVVLMIGFFLFCNLLLSQLILKNHALRAADELAFTILSQTERQIIQFFGEMEALAKGLAFTDAVRSKEASAMRDLFLGQVLSRSRYLRSIYLGTTDGKMFEWGTGIGFIDHVPVFPPGYDPRIRPWYTLAIKTGRFAVTEPYQYASIDAQGITCVIPVFDRAEKLIGVLGLDILLDSVIHIMDDLDLPKQGRVAILDGSSNLMASQFDEAIDFNHFLPSQTGYDLSAAQQFVQGSFRTSIHDEPFQLAYRRLANLDFTVVVGIPHEEILSGIKELLRIISLFDLAMILTMVLLVSAITGRMVVAPLNTMVAVIERKREGEQSARVSLKSSDEFGILAAELNNLFDLVDQYSDTLEEKVRLRGRELWQLQQENTVLRIAEERKRIYQDLHDSIGAKLTNIFFCINVAREHSSSASSIPSEMFVNIEENCLQAVHSLKEIVSGMKESDKLASDTVHLLTVSIKQRLANAGIDLDCRVVGKHHYNARPTGIRDEINYLFEELVSNVLKHACASRVKLRIRATADTIFIFFADNGKGFTPAAVQFSANGLNTIRDRVARLGGQLQCNSDSGTTYRIELPRSTRHE